MFNSPPPFSILEIQKLKLKSYKFINWFTFDSPPFLFDSKSINRNREVKKEKNNKAWRRRMKMSGRLKRERWRWGRERWLVSHVHLPFFFFFFIFLIQSINMWLFYLFYNSKITHMTSCMRWPSQNWSFA